MNQSGGVSVFYSNKMEVRNTVFFQDGTYAYYDTGGMLFEQISDEAIYLTTEKVINMIRAYPRYDSPLSREVLDDGFAWLYCAIDDEELPVATAVFCSSFGEAIKVVSHADGADNAYKSVGEFLEACYEEYIRHVQSFCAFFDALAAEASKKGGEFQSNLAKIFHETADSLYVIYARKCSVRQKKGSMSVETQTISNTIQLLFFEYCRLKKEGKDIKICENCGRYFISKRSNAKYCQAPSPQDSSRSCREIGPQAKRKEQLNTSPFEREHHKARSRLNMAIKRARDSGDECLIPELKQRLEKENEKYNSQKRDNDFIGGK